MFLLHYSTFALDLLYGLVPPFGHTQCAALAAIPTSEDFYDFFAVWNGFWRRLG